MVARSMAVPGILAACTLSLTACCNMGPAQHPVRPRPSVSLKLPATVTAIAVSGRAGLCAVATNDSRCLVYSTRGTVLRRSINLAVGRIAWGAAFSPGGHTLALAVGTRKGTKGARGLALYGVKSGWLKWAIRPAGRIRPTPEVAAAQDGNVIAFYAFPMLVVARLHPYVVLLRKFVGVHCSRWLLRVSAHGRYILINANTIFFSRGGRWSNLQKISLHDGDAASAMVAGRVGLTVSSGTECYLGASIPMILFKYDMPAGRLSWQRRLLGYRPSFLYVLGSAPGGKVLLGSQYGGASLYASHGRELAHFGPFFGGNRVCSALGPGILAIGSRRRIKFWHAPFSFQRSR